MLGGGVSCFLFGPTQSLYAGCRHMHYRTDCSHSHHEEDDLGSKNPWLT